MRAMLAAVLLTLASPALADSVTGTVALYDAATTTMTMTDRTVWILGDMAPAAPAALAPGARVTLLYRTAGEDGLTGIDAVTVDGAGTGPLAASAPRS